MSDERKHKGWHSRGFLPHLDAAEIQQAITFRLADALPKQVVDGWKHELAMKGSQENGHSDRELRQRIARYEDAGYGSCILRDSSCAAIVRDALLHFDAERYRLLEWCVMPNHVHVLVHCLNGTLLGEMVKSWKIHSGRKINQRLGRHGALWALDYHDRYIRDLDHLANARSYNPTQSRKGRLVPKPGGLAMEQRLEPRDRESVTRLTMEGERDAFQTPSFAPHRQRV